MLRVGGTGTFQIPHSRPAAPTQRQRDSPV